MSTSFGVSKAAAGEDLVDGIKRADEAMYLAKANGRDRVELILGGAQYASLPSQDAEPSDFSESEFVSQPDDSRVILQNLWSIRMAPDVTVKEYGGHDAIELRL